MMTKKEKLITLVTNILSFVMILAVVVPFGKNSVSNGEVIFKCLVAPIIMCVIFAINSYIKYVVGSAEYKYNSFSAYLPIFGYLASLLMYVALVSLRAGAGAIFESDQWILVTFFLVLGAGVAVVLGILIHRFIVMINTKENIFLDLALFVVLVILTAVIKGFLGKHIGILMNDNVLQFIVVPMLLCLAVLALLVFIMMNLLQYNEKFVYASRQELLDKWNEGRDSVYEEAREDILFNLYLFSKEQLGIYDELDVPEEEVAEEEAVEEAAPETQEEENEEVQVEESDEETEQRIAELLKEKEELTVEPEEEPKPAVVYPPKEFKPTFNEMVKLAMSFDGVTYQAKADGTNYKFLVNKKVFLILADTPKDYRLTFLMDTEEAAVLSQNTSFSKAKSPKGDYYFKLVNKGDFDEITIHNIIKNAYGMVEVLAERDRIAKEEEKARKAAEKLQAKLDAMTPEEREAYLARQEKRRLAQEKKLAKEAELAAQEAEKPAEEKAE